MHRSSSSPAFSLLEVMVAMAILSVGIVSLLQVQSRSAQLAMEARELTVATMLARSKLYDCQHDLLRKGFSIGDYDEDGNFDDDGYPKYYWECHAYAPDMPTGDGVGDMGGAASMLGGGATNGSSAAAPPGSEMGMQMLAPVVQQLATVMKDSIRELVVIVRWGEGEDRQELRVATHLIDKGPVNRVAAMIQQQSQALGAATGAAGAAAGGGLPGVTPPTGGGLRGSPGTPGAGGLK